MARFVTVAIDGTAASGKTSTASVLARKYNFLMASTGLYYRALTVKMLNGGVDADDGAALGRFLGTFSPGTRIVDGAARLTLNGDDCDDGILRSREVNGAVSHYSSMGVVRDFLTAYQRSQVDIARANGFGGLVMEGRDITSVILPNADLKFFLEASATVRSNRRSNDDGSDDVAGRDRIDGARTICLDGVRRIDTGTNDLTAVIALISSEIDGLLAADGANHGPGNGLRR
jgi:cytidylate kinase